MSADLTRLGQGYFAQAQTDKTMQTLERLAEKGKSRKDELSAEDQDKIREQAVKFEAMFVKKMLDAMRKTVPESDLFGPADSAGKTIYRSMLDAEYANLMASHQSFGIADMLLDQFGVKPPETSGITSLLGVESLGGSAMNYGGERFSPPLNGRISSPFGLRADPFNGKETMHKGIDLAIASGSRVHASQSGTVAFAGEKGGYGKVVIIEHDNGFQSIYGHLNNINVARGDKVHQGQVIAKSGNTGRSTGPHLHFEIQKDGRPINPALVVNLR